MISGGRAASISERESSLAFLKMTHYSTQPYARIDVGGKATRRCDLLPSGGAGDWRGPLQRWREQLQLFSPALLRARRRASVPTLQHSPSIHSREATRPHARPRPHLLCFNVLPWSQRASRHDSIAMAGALWIAKAHGPLRRAARAGATQIRALAPRAFISAFSCRCSVGSNSPYSHSAAGGRRAVSTRIRISCTPQGAATTWTSPMDCVCGRGGQFAVQRIIEQDEMSV